MKTERNHLVYDGSFTGFLTTVYQAFVSAEQPSDIVSESCAGIFRTGIVVVTDRQRALRVWKGLQKKSPSALKSIYFAFLSETGGIEILLYRYIRSLFYALSPEEGLLSGEIEKINELAAKVGYEKRHLEGALNLQELGGNISIAKISPKYNVLPLISRHFRHSMKNRQWLIYDQKRKYGIHFYLGKTSFVGTDFLEELFRMQELISEDSSTVLSGPGFQLGGNPGRCDQFVRNAERLKPGTMIHRPAV